jgi:hypothetical protein
MKRSNLKKLALLCGVLSVSSHLAYAQDNVDIPQLQNRMQLVQTEVRNIGQLHNQAEGSIVVIGDAGAGKSTLITALAQRELIAQQSAAGFHLVAQNPLPGIEIGNVVGTRNPAAWYDAGRRVLIWDCPGFNGPSDNAKEIANAFSVTQVFRNRNQNNVANIKLVVAVQESDLTGRPTPLLNALKRLTQIFPNNNIITPSLSLVITKKTDINPQAILEQRFNACVQNNLNNPDDRIALMDNPRVRELFQFLATNAATRVSFMTKPTAVGAYQGGNRDGIFQVIGDTSYMVNPEVTVALNDPQRGLMLQLGEGLKTGIRAQLSGPISTAVQNACEGLVDNRQLPTTAAQIKGTFSQRLTLLNNIDVQSSAEFLTTTTTFLQPFALADQLGDVRVKTGCLNFCHELNANLDLQIQGWKDSLGALSLRIQGLANAPSLQNRIELNGHYIDRTTTTFPAGEGRGTWPVTGRILIDDVGAGAVPPPPAPVVIVKKKGPKTFFGKLTDGVIGH